MTLPCPHEKEKSRLQSFPTTLPCPHEEEKSRSQSFPSSLQSSTTYWAIDYSTPTTDSQIQLYQIPRLIQLGCLSIHRNMCTVHLLVQLKAIVQDAANSQGTAGHDSCSFDQDDASINTSSNDEYEATF
ncbi:hypothetical protein AAC387_Pa02g5062 [Persea americana]